MKPEDAAQDIRNKAAAYGEAKAQRVYLEEFRKSKKALLMKDALQMGYEAANAQEREAYADPEYHTLLKGLAAAIAQEETLGMNNQSGVQQSIMDIWIGDGCV